MFSKKDKAEAEQDLAGALATVVTTELSKSRRHANYRMMAIAAIIIFSITYNLVATKSVFGRSASLQIPADEPYAALVRIRGTIEPGGSGSAEFLKPVLTRAFMDENAVGVVLLINSPGGTPVQADALHDYIVRMKEKYNKKVIAIGEDQLTSGAYMTAVAADRIYVNESTIAGSIGVIMANKGFSELADRLGVENRVITSGEFKHRLDPFEELKPDDVVKMKASLAKIHEHFIATVVAGREGRLNAAPEVLFSGDFWTGEEVVEMGLVDGIGDLETVLEQDFGVSYALDYSRRKGLFAGLSDALVSTAAERMVETLEAKLDIERTLPVLK